MRFSDDEISLSVFEIRTLLDIFIMSAHFKGIDKKDRAFKEKKYFQDKDRIPCIYMDGALHSLFNSRLFQQRRND